MTKELSLNLHIIIEYTQKKNFNSWKPTTAESNALLLSKRVNLLNSQEDRSLDGLRWFSIVHSDGHHSNVASWGLPNRPHPCILIVAF